MEGDLKIGRNLPWPGQIRTLLFQSTPRKLLKRLMKLGIAKEKPRLKIFQLNLLQVH